MLNVGNLIQDLCTFDIIKVARRKKMVEQLVERIRQKDQRAMSQLYRMYVKRLSSVCFRYVPDEDDAKDVLQDSFVKIFTALDSFVYHDETSFMRWMIKIVVNEALHFLKERSRLLFIDIQEDSIEAEDDMKADYVTADELHQMISELPDGYRTVINLFVFEGYSHQEIADILGIERATSASQLYFAKRLLAKRIKEQTSKK